MEENATSLQVIFIVKVIVASLVGALAIKYIAPAIPIPVNGLSALTIIFTPVIVMMGLFIARGRRDQNNT
ncbi:hypothetical protein [Sodalinema gerasimenkoae]|uniref:hypothetical protein n=1 Tax=Sodalinema gerasimenkoae TaxID=2862348 RepID=UPI001CA54F72|nr:hypothetical protein [Sodalinema gerasimenkoae]